MPYRADLEGRREWAEHERPQAEDWWWDQDGVLIVILPSPAGMARLQGWTVTGPKEAPTVTPSILQRGIPDGDSWEPDDGPIAVQELWHGFLTAGEFKAC